MSHTFFKCVLLKTLITNSLKLVPIYNSKNKVYIATLIDCRALINSAVEGLNLFNPFSSTVDLHVHMY